jgi:hypothetical protein
VLLLPGSQAALVLHNARASLPEQIVTRGTWSPAEAAFPRVLTDMPKHRGSQVTQAPTEVGVALHTLPPKRRCVRAFRARVP